jgi:hypothetical protein
MSKHSPNEETGRVIAVTVALWAIAVAAATAQGVFERMGEGEFAALAIFATLYAPATYRIDRRIREYVLARPVRHVMLATAALNLVLAAALTAGAPWPIFAFLGLPLAAVAHFALVERLWLARRAPKSAPARSPGASQAAI